jgi:hypothetical protein
LAHQGAVRQEHEIHVAGLALAAPELTIAHAQMLLPVPMEGLRDSPALPIGLEDPMDFAIRTRTQIVLPANRMKVLRMTKL